MLYPFINKNSIHFNSEASDKKSILSEAADLLCASAKNVDRDVIYKKLVEREEKGSTGIGHGIAIPHASYEGFSQFRVAVITLAKGVNFDSIDSEPVRIVFAMMGPDANRNTHVSALATISRLSQTEKFVDSFLKINSVEALLSFFESKESSPKSIPGIEKKSLLLAFVQNQSYLEPLLEVLASVPNSGVTVLEGSGAGRYLHSLPLYSMFWTDESQKEDVKVVLAVIDAPAGNETFRRLSSTVFVPGKDKGILITLQDLALTAGSLDI